MRPTFLFSSAVTLFATLLFAPAAYADCTTPDVDGDGHSAIVCGGDDCDDTNPARYPSAVEICDAADLDEDCNYDTPGFRDMDGDGFNDDACRNISPSGFIVGGDDCDDSNASVHRIAGEICNGIDDNCDGAIDDGLTREFYLDADGDGFGSQSVGLLCPQSGADYASRSGDCNDANESIFPGMQVCVSATDVEICGLDGLWAADTCDIDQECIAQPNDLGVCANVATGNGNNGNGNGNGNNGNGNGNGNGK